MKPAEFNKAVIIRHNRNVMRYGDQGGLLLVAVLTEEMGEVSQAMLEHLKNPGDHSSRRVVEECIDAGAVLMALADEITRWPEEE